MKSFVDDVSKNIVDSVPKDLKESGESGGSGKASADSWMVAIAKAMGQRAEKLVGLSKAMSETQTGTDTASHRSKRRPRKCRSATSTTRPSARFTTASR